MFGFGEMGHAGGLIGIVALLLAFGVGYAFARSPEDGGRRLYQLYVHGASFLLLIVLIASAMTIARGLGDLVASSGYDQVESIDFTDSAITPAPNKNNRRLDDERRTRPPEPPQVSRARESHQWLAPRPSGLANVGRLLTGLLMGLFALLLFLFHWKRVEELHKAWNGGGV